MFELGMLLLAATAAGLIALHQAQGSPERRTRHMLQQSSVRSLDSAQEGGRRWFAGAGSRSMR